ncbi:phosphatidylinositol 4-phosphate 5-kinase (macronuclear) [Tetrahymena thermophila SB210]|uniref:Phosphatidylinositol 4-phosphate 5-kinase n=1 Tax=Tetrahymena thermophila (strain SB210) TaxID=312017 RepID=Q23WQ3_TETTS|nr:phosphatidylinositol 4-phosphate 5-kinase [Tetrahymena thermophila SB210]EAS00927.2 phosphatidylinositol 4-phosphate 5-kinase [Tetrahymena thermophila SB210]|eukprot:XP_001021172.2 phosphatidylinositol 4-phosphate 5-kinase [Tetrahymena thermophila SB210]
MFKLINLLCECHLAKIGLKNNIIIIIALQIKLQKRLIKYQIRQIFEIIKYLKAKIQFGCLQNYKIISKKVLLKGYLFFRFYKIQRYLIAQILFRYQASQLSNTITNKQIILNISKQTILKIRLLKRLMKIAFQINYQNIKWVFLIAFIFFIRQTKGFLDYTQDNLSNCSIEYNDEERQQKFKLHIIDQYAFIILSPISIISNLIIIILFLKYKESRKQPSDIIFFISISDLILSIHWFSSAIYAISKSQVPDNDDIFCQINSFFSITSGSIEYLYNLFFCIFLITRIRNTIKGFRIKKSFIHFFTIVGSIGFYLLQKFQGRAQLNLYGVCSYKVDSTSWIIGVSIFVVYLFISWLTIYYFKKYVPNITAFVKHRTEFLQFYYFNVLFISISWSILVASNIIVGINCTYELSPFLNIFITVGNIIKLVTPIVLSIVRYFDPTLQGCIQNHKLARQSTSSELINLSFNKPILNAQVGLDWNQSTSKDSLSSRHRRVSNWSHVISANLKILRIQSIILGLFMQDELISQQAPQKDQIQNLSFVYDQQILKTLPEVYLKKLHMKYETHKMRIKFFFPLEFKQLREKDSKFINIKKDFDLIENFKSLQNMAETGDGGKSGELLFFNHDKTLLMKTISRQDVQSFQKFGKQYFQYVMNENPDTFIIKIYGMYSFTRADTRDLKTYVIFMRNIANVPSQNILRRYDLKGSRFDREVLTKYKIQAEDLPNYSNIEEFQNQLDMIKEFNVIKDANLNNLNSCESRNSDFDIKNVVCQNQIKQQDNTNQNETLNDNQNIRNINKFGKIQGIDFQRQQTIQNWIELYNQPIFKRELSCNMQKSINQNINISKITMKDLDFLKLEKQIYVDENYIKFIKQSLEKDCLFFKENGIIDYSLLVFKVASQVSHNQESSTEKENLIFQSKREKYIDYHIGIIDYLQEWNIDKMLEQKAKQAIHANLNLNVSSQNPETYQSRFKQNIIDSLF